MSRNPDRNPYEFSQQIKEEALSRSNLRCEGCGRSAKRRELQIHHIIPVWFAIQYPLFSIPLITSIANTKVLCLECHKQTMHYNEDEILMLAWIVLNKSYTMKKVSSTNVDERSLQLADMAI